MKVLLLTILGSLAVSPLASGQIIVYEETFPYPAAQGSGDQPISTAGWANDIPNNPNRLYQSAFPDGAVYAYQTANNTTAFYTSTVLDTGASGMAFPSINPASYNGLTFSVDVQPGFNPTNVRTRIAVQIGGTSWYVASTNLPVPTAAGGFATYTVPFDPAAAKWNALTLNGTSATIGAPVPGPLSGNITGAGLVVTHGATDGTHNFDNFRITAVPDAPPPVLFGQKVVIYQQTFPYGNSGNFSLNTVGWADDIPNSNSNRLYQSSGGDGAFFANQSSALTTAFYTSTMVSTNTATPAAVFPAIDPTLYPGLTLSADIQPSLNPANVTARFAVQMNGGSWFASASPLPVPAVVGAFATYSNRFDATATNWRTLTVSGNGTATSATVGGVTGANLTGNITGAGLVFTHTASGTFNCDNFLITATNLGSLAVNTVSNGSAITIPWPAALNVRLQSTTNLSGTGWTDLPDTSGKNTATLPTAGARTFFRLTAFPMGGLLDGGFESTNVYWQSSGDTASASFLSAGAFAGTFCLQHSNSASYSVQTFQLATNLPNGYYKLTAMIKNSDGFGACYLGANDKWTGLPIYQSWSNIIVRGITVSNGQCLVSLVSSRPAGGHWCRLDFVQLIKDDLPYNFLKGGDISELTYVEQNGGKYYETNGVETDCLQIMTNHGCNIVRLRLYNDPGNPAYTPSNRLPPGIQSPTNILALAARAKAKGMQIQLTFYYSDYWSNVKPHDWVGLTFPQLTNAVYQFTTNFMALMKNQGTTPEYVSLGNEMQGGILTPDGASSNFANLTQLLNAGYDAVKQVSPTTKVILHVNNVESGGVQWFFDQCVSSGVKWDIIGCSYYPYWTGFTSEQAKNQINTFYPRYNKPVIIMETGYNWATNRCDGFTGQLANNGPELFPSTPQGQKEFMLNCFNSLKQVNHGHCIGDLYWDPIFICVPGLGWELGAPNVVDNYTIFDFTGHVLPSLDAFFFNN